MGQTIPAQSKDDQPRSAPVRRAYSPKEAAAVLGLCERSIYNLIERGKLPDIRVLSRRLIPVEAIEALLKSPAPAELTRPCPQTSEHEQ
jgi:excisionase family DNA binding protein